MLEDKQCKFWCCFSIIIWVLYIDIVFIDYLVPISLSYLWTYSSVSCSYIACCPKSAINCATVMVLNFFYNLVQGSPHLVKCLLTAQTPQYCRDIKSKGFVLIYIVVFYVFITYPVSDLFWVLPKIRFTVFSSKF